MLLHIVWKSVHDMYSVKMDLAKSMHEGWLSPTDDTLIVRVFARAQGKYFPVTPIRDLR